MWQPRLQRQRFWIVFAYLWVIALVLWPALHENFGVRIILWNWLPPTLGLLLITTAFGKSKPRMIASAAFALPVAALTIFFVAAWLFTPLDTDPHSITTKFVFVFGPLFSLALALAASAIGWLTARIMASAKDA